MKLRYFELLTFRDFYDKIKDKKLPLKVAYKLSKTFSGIDHELVFYRQKIQEIMNKYGEKNEKGEFVLTDDKKGIQIKPESIAQCQMEMNELHNLEVEIEAARIPVELLDGLEFSLAELDVLMPFIEE